MWYKVDVFKIWFESTFFEISFRIIHPSLDKAIMSASMR